MAPTRPTPERLQQLSEEFKRAQEQRPKLQVPGLTQDALRKQVARDSLASKIKFNRRFPGTYDIEACRAALERAYGPLDE